MQNKILVFDIEVSDLRADWGHLICFGYKVIGEKDVQCLSVLDYPGKNAIDDRELVRAAHRVLTSADMVVGFYSRGFDIKFLQAKFLQYGLAVLPNNPHIDLFFVAKTNMALSRKSLDNIGRYLNLPSKKYRVSGDIWKLARIGDKDAIAKVVDHCKADVLMTEKLYYRLRPLVRTHPRVDGWAPCRNCGSRKLQRRGYAMTATKGKRIRIQCMSCSSWETRSEEHAETVGEQTA